MSNTISKYILYLRDCYSADARGSVISNIYGSNIESRIFLDYEELVTGSKEEQDIDMKKASAACKKAYMYRKEMELLYCSTFLLGTLRNDTGEPQKICAPLLFFPAKIAVDEEEGSSRLSIDRSGMQVNFGLISMIYGDNREAIKRYDMLSGELGKLDNKLDRDPILNAAQILESKDLTVDTSNFILYPVLVSGSGLKKAFKKLTVKQAGALTLYNAGAVILVKKSKLERGLLDELARIAEQDSVSKPVYRLFDGSAFRKGGQKGPGGRLKRRISMEGRTPAILSSAQNAIMESAKKNSLSLVIGPPGTGKSFTIASVALEHLSRGESVLIASKMDHAVDVIADKIESQIGVEGVTVRGGDKNYLKKLKNYISELFKNNSSIYHERLEQVGEQLELVKDFEKSIRSLEKDFSRQERNEQRWGEFLFSYNVLQSHRNVFGKWRYRFIEKRKKSSSYLPRLITEIHSKQEARNKDIIKLITMRNNRRIWHTLSFNKKTLQLFDNAIRARTDGKQEELFKQIDFQQLLKTFPIWLVSTTGIYNILPLEKELFDLAIIDEATQCDMASCIPILFRAKRTVIVGDPNQLRHISFLSRYQQFLIGAEQGLRDSEVEDLDYRNKSILDLANERIKAHKHIQFLDEHFRSLPRVIEFSNNHFYNNSLRIMTGKPGLRDHTAIEVVRCKGTRTKQGVNKEECEAILAMIKKIVKEQKNLDPQMSQSIGILFPFRDQVDYMYKALMNSFPIDTIEKHSMLVGTAYTFQGEERDTMFISFAVDNTSHKNTHYFISKPDVLNVSITRARVKQYVFLSIDPGTIGQDLLFRSYVEYALEVNREHEREKEKERGENFDVFLEDVIAALKLPGVRLYPAYEIAGLTIDLVIEYKHKTCGIDLIGYPGEFGESFSLDRYKMYYRAGLQIVPLSYSEWCFHKDTSLDEIKKSIGYREG
ncbi:MAG: AAA family ATPase [bacterium]|nr:AAA family ATPase [bacterium]